MIPVNQFILGSSDPLLYPSEKMTNSINEQIAFLQSQKQAINEAYRRNAYGCLPCCFTQPARELRLSNITKFEFPFLFI